MYMDKPIKIAIITNIPTPYRKALWEYYSKHYLLDITVFYCSHIEKNRYWDVDSSKGVKEVFLSGLNFKSIHFNPGVLKVLFQDFDIFFVGGYGYPSVIMAITVLKCLKKPWVMIIDGVSPLKLENENFMTEKLRRIFIKGANAYFANGTVGYKLLEKYSISSEKIFNQFMTVDVEHFMKKGVNSLNYRNEIRKKYNISKNSIVVMYAGRLVEHKGVQDLIKSVRKLEDKGYNVKLLVAGDGQFKKKLINCADKILPDTIFTGHIDPNKLYKYYYASDIFVLPTYDDPWGLVINEAMSCGLPVVLTNAAGSSLDLVKNNGIVVQNGNIIQLSEAIESLILGDLSIYGENSLIIMRKWSYKESFESFLNLIHFIRRNS